MDQVTLDYFSGQQRSRQWHAFLAALSAEFTARLSPEELRTLMRQTGLRFAGQSPLPASDTLPALQDAMNAVWAAQDWGWVELEETPDHLALQHRFSPLSAHFSEADRAWAAGFLEGVYQQWFQQIGVSDALHVQQTHHPDPLGTLAFRLGR